MLSICSSFCFSPFPPSLTWLAVASPPFIFLSLPPPIFHHSNCMKQLATARKSFQRFQEIVKKDYIWWEGHDESTDISEYQKAKGGRHLNPRLSLPISPPNRRMTGRRVSGNSLRPMMCPLKWFTPLFTRICSSQRSWPGEWLNCLTRRWRRSESRRARPW
jgi:hypothetical protein